MFKTLCKAAAAEWGHVLLPACVLRAPGMGHNFGAFSRFCMLLLKASCCVSLCLHLPSANGAIPPTYLSLQGSGHRGVRACQVVPHRVGWFLGGCSGGSPPPRFVMTYVNVHLLQQRPAQAGAATQRCWLHLAIVPGQQSGQAPECLCRAVLQGAAPICVQDGQNTPPASGNLPAHSGGCGLADWVLGEMKP